MQLIHREQVFSFSCYMLNASLKGDIQRQVKWLYCAAKKVRGTFARCSPVVKTL